MNGVKLFLFIALILPGILSVSDLLRIACIRTPTAPFCPSARAHSSNLLVEPPPNLFLRDDSEKKHSAGILIDDLEASAPSDEDFEVQTTPKSPFAPADDTVTLYCRKYRKHSSYYCQKQLLARASDNLIQFCESYSSNCKDYLATAASSTGDEDFFGAEVRTTPAPSGGGGIFSQFQKPGGSGADIFSRFQKRGPKPLAEDKALELLKKKRPCTADCDQRIWKHCTHDCKCDHDYPYVQRFCNPPPLPMFLMTCRLWYALCPKYEIYHYASQFIYSKAEKGKVLPGTDVNLAKAEAQRRLIG
ncbi:hypothetical protein QR680_018644 [Steinernema hermaphroditum]|uniref:ShKT domain-containing protein n=1 Tax=Steinernema hermaphroditum TaxID=289476 RepID=A0AA39HIL2_9BILA|nr:hypothetical protein QR680_018644 [Steinernema hermaphroditum]